MPQGTFARRGTYLIVWRLLPAAVIALAVAASSRICVAAGAAQGAVVLEAKDEGSLNIAGVRATIDGTQTIGKLDGTPIPLQAGPHRAVFDAAGYRRVETSFVVAEGQKLRVVVFLMLAPSELPLAAPSPTPVPRDEAAPAGGRRRTIGLALVGGGALGVVVGTIWSFRSRATYDDALSSDCGGDPNACSPQGIAGGQSAHRQAAIATAGFVAGGVMLAAGAALFFTGRTRASVALAPEAGGGGSLVMAGRW